MGAPLLHVANLSVDYWTGSQWVEVVSDVSFDIRAGEVLGLAGESGCGKSTLAYALMGEARRGSRIRSGKVELNGRNILAVPGNELQALRGKSVSFVPQNPMASLTPSMSIGRQIGEIFKFHDVVSSAGREARTRELITAVGLQHPERIARSYPHELSGGQQQRALIAMALAGNPDLIVLDEPTTGLDVTTQKLILNLLMSLKRERGMAMLYVSHDLAALSQICDRIAVMYAGELIEVSPAVELFTAALHPYTKGLVASIPRLDCEPDRRNALTGSLRRSELPPGCRFTPRCPYGDDACAMSQQTLASASHGRSVACRLWKDINAGVHAT